MINLRYTFEHPSFTGFDCFVRQFRMGQPFEVFTLNEVLIGQISKGEDGWEQTSGRQMPQALVDGIGRYLDDNKLWR